MTRTILAALVAVAVSGPILRARQAAPAAAPKPEVLLKVDVVLSRFQGDKKTGSLPFALLVNTPDRGSGSSSVRVGVDVPVGTSAITRRSGVPQSGGTGETTTTNNATDYRNVGTSIDCRTSQLPDGRFTVGITVQDSSLFSPEAERLASLFQKGLISRTQLAAKTDSAAFKTFTATNTLPMRDGQTLEFSAVSDKISGETLKVAVTINIVK